MRPFAATLPFLIASGLIAQSTPARVTAILGAGKAGSWDTAISVTNVESLHALPIVITAQYRSTLECPSTPCNDYASATIPPFGSFDLPAIPDPPDSSFSNRPQVFYVLYPQAQAAPAVIAVAADSTSACGRSDTLPALLFEEAFALPDLVFSGARRNSARYVNLLVAADPHLQTLLPVTVAAADGNGFPAGNSTFLSVPPGSSVLIVDVLGQLGVTSLESGSLRVSWTPPDFLTLQSFAAVMTIVEPDRVTAVRGIRAGS